MNPWESRSTRQTRWPGTKRSQTQHGSVQNEGLFEDDIVDLAMAAAVNEPRRYSEGIFEPVNPVYVYGAVADDERYGKKIDASNSRLFTVRSESPEGLTEQDDGDVRSIAKNQLVGAFMMVFGRMFTASGVMVLSAALLGVL